jgi:hypothetical protein
LGRAIAQTAVTCETNCSVKTTGRHSHSPSAVPSATPSDEPSATPTTSPSSLPSTGPSDVPRSGTLINFDSHAVGFYKLQDGYMGLKWENFYRMKGTDYPNSGYGHGITSGAYVAFNGYGNAASFSAPISTATFSLRSMQATSAWYNNNVLTIEGYEGENIVATKAVTTETSGPMKVVFDNDFMGLTKVRIFTSNAQVAIDDVDFSF